MRSDNRDFSNPEFATAYEDNDEFDLAPELTITKAAEIAREFFKDLPDDMVDIDLGSDF